MKKSTKYLIARLVIMVLCMVIGFGIGRVSKRTEVIEVNVESPIVRVSEPVEETKKEVAPTYKEIKVIATAYCPCVECCEKDDGITATGVKAEARHTIAADPEFLPYGTELLFDCNIWVVEDCGGAIKGENRIDIFFDTHEEAVNFGVQEFSVWVKEEK